MSETTKENKKETKENTKKETKEQTEVELNEDPAEEVKAEIKEAEETPQFKQTSRFVHLHCHSEYSSLDGGSKISAMPEKLKSLGMASMALTDHGVMQGIPDFYFALKDAGIKPILGLEAYMTEDQADKKGQTWHITLLAENNQGYKNLCKISSWAFIDGAIPAPGGRIRARADWKLLEKFSEGIICLTGCMAGPVMNEIMIKGNLSEAKRNVKRMIDIFGKDNVYGEIQNVGIITAIPADSELAKKLGKEPLTAEEAANYTSPHGDVSEEIGAGDVPISQTEANAEVIEICKELGLPYVATGDVHYLDEDDAYPHDAMLCIGTGQVQKGKRYFQLLPQRYHMRSEEEMMDSVKLWPESLDETLKVADRCNVEIEWGQELLPSYPLPEGFTKSKDYLKHLCLEGLEERYPEGNEFREEAFTRLDYELGVIDNMGYNDYFLIVWDFNNYANEHGIPTGPGRGCLTGDVPIWTPEGYKPIKDVEVGEKVITHTGKLANVKKRWEYDCDEELVEIKSVYGHESVTLTKDHKVLARKLTSNPKHHKPREYSSEDWYEASELKKGDQVVVPNIDKVKIPKIKAPEYIDLSKYVKNIGTNGRTKIEIFDDKIIERRRRTKNSVKTSAAWAGELGLHPSNLKNHIYRNRSQGAETAELIDKKVKELDYDGIDDWREKVKAEKYLTLEFPRFIKVDEEFCYLLGLMVSDGCTHKRDSNVAWCEKTSESDQSLLELIRTVWGDNIDPYHIPDGRGKDVHSYVVKSAVVKELYKSLMPSYTYKAYTKCLPNWYLSLDESKTQALLDGLWKGDGHNNPVKKNGKLTSSNITGYSSSSKNLSFQVRNLLNKLKIPSALFIDHRNYAKTEGFENSRPIYRINCPGNFRNSGKSLSFDVEDKKTFLNIREINIIPNNKRKVYDLEIDSKDHSYLTSSFIVHNSAAGAMVAYTLDITKLDPLLYKLLFERFLNPRKSMPDVDFDSGVKPGRGREEIIEYVREKYNTLAGIDTAVCQVVTFSKFKARGALRDSARILADPVEGGREEALKLGDSLAGMIPDDPKATMKSVWKDKHEGKLLRAAYNRGGKEQEIIKQAGWMEELVRAYSTHAAAVIIGDHDLTDDAPLQKLGDKKELETQYDMSYTEKLGLLKMDFLGIKTLDIIWDAVDKIKHVHGVEISPYKDIPLDDKKTYDMLADGKSIGTFQLESGGMQGALQTIRPTEFNDLIAIVALYRPGPMTHIPTYAARKRGDEEVTYIDPKLEAILDETYGIVCIEENQEIAMADGSLKAIKNIVRGEKVSSFDLEDNNKAVIEEVHGVRPTRFEKGLEITLGDGSQTILTKDHKVLTPRGYVKVQDLDIKKDLVATPSRIINKPGKSLDQEWLGKDTDLAYLFGQLTGDGSLSSNTITISTGLIDNHKKLLRFINENLNLVTNEYFHCRSWYISISNPELLSDAKSKGHGNRKTRFHKMFEDFGMKQNCYNKSVPSPIFEASSEVKASYLAGLFDADGNITKTGTLVSTSVSEELLKGVKHLLLSLGITSRTKRDRLYISDSVSAKEALSDKTLRIDWSKVSIGVKDRTRLILRSDFKKTVDSLGIPGRQFAKKYGVSRSTAVADKPFMLEGISNKIPEHKTNGDICYRPIVSITETEEKQFYGMSVDRTHNMICGSMVIKNCYQEQSMLIARELGGFTPGQADDLRKAIGKKLRDKMDLLKAPYIKGCLENGISKQDAEILWADNEAAADYSFNKCLHSQTRVILPDGKRLRLSEAYNQNIKEIMSMWSDGEIRPHKVKKIVQTGSKPLYHIKTEAGRQIKATEDHRLLTNEGYVEVKDMTAGETEVISMPMISEKQREARRKNMTELSQRPERAEQDKRAGERMIAYQAGRSMEDKIAHMKKMHETYPELTKNAVPAMHARLEYLRANDPEWVKKHRENSLASVRDTYNTGPGYGNCSIASNDMWCASNPEREMCEYLIENDVEFEMNKVLPNGRICDFYFDGLYWEMDGMDRTIEYFKEKYNEIGLPFVVVTPEDYKQVIAQKTEIAHAENGDLIVSIEYWGEGPTYDIEMESDGPKNFLANGIVSHNSHAACYAYLAYITAYLKANYPEEFMAALLNSAMGHKDKPGLYLTESKRMELNVLPPDVNRSLRDYAVQRNEDEPEKLEVLFGLEAVKKVSGAVVEQLLEERKARGNFTSIYDIIRRIPKISKASLHALIQGGALDSFGNSRKALYDATETILEETKKKIKAEERMFINEIKAECDGTIEIPGLAEEKKDTWKLTMLGRKGIEAGAKEYHNNDLVSDEDLQEAIKVGLEKQVASAEKSTLRKEAKEKGEEAVMVQSIANEEEATLELSDIIDAKGVAKVKEMEKEIAQWSSQLLTEVRQSIKEVLLARSEKDGLEAAMEEEADIVLDGEEWDEIEKLNMERQILGVYVSGHPLQEDAKKWANYVTKGLGQLDDKSIGQKHKVVGAIVGLQPIRTKTGKDMARVTLEDLTGARDLIIFPETYAGGPNELLEEGNVLYFGVSVNEDKFQQQQKDKKKEEGGEGVMAVEEDDNEKPIQLVVNEFFRWDAEKLDDPDVARAHYEAHKKPVNNAPILIEIRKEQFSAAFVRNLQILCKENPGDAPVRISVDGELQKTDLTIAGDINLTLAVNELLA